MMKEEWPSLPFDAWQDSCATLHLWTQIVGKIRLARAPMVNHWWNVTLYVTARGLTTSPMPDQGGCSFQIDFDFVDHRLIIAVSDGRRESFALKPMTVAAFYAELMGCLRTLGIDVKISPLPVELPNPIPFAEDRTHAAYDPDYVNRFWRALVIADRLLKNFRCSFTGKVSPVHLFWGAMDLAVTRFSGRMAPRHPGVPFTADLVTLEAYSHEVSSAGFWAGNGGFGQPAFYSYAYPQPPGYAEAIAQPDIAYYSKELGEFILPYETVRQAPAPEKAVLDFLQSTYEAAAIAGKWDRSMLERSLAA